MLWSEVEIARRLAEKVQCISGTRPRTKDCHIRTGKPFQEITATAEELKADLIVIATHGHSGFKHLTLGSTTEKIIRHAKCPVLVVCEATRGPIKTAADGIVLEKILVPVDFSECAREGARYASVFATRVGAPPARACRIATEGAIVGPDWPQLVETALLEAENKLDAMVNFLPLAGISAETQVAVGAPIDKLTEETTRPDVDMVITSTHGYSGMRHALLGQRCGAANTTRELPRAGRAESSPCGRRLMRYAFLC